MSSITKSIQKEYVLLMENAFSEKYKSAFRKFGLLKVIDYYFQFNVLVITYLITLDLWEFILIAS